MLRADRAHLEARIAQLALEVRAREAKLFDQNFQLLSKLSAFCTGIGFLILFCKPQYVKKVSPRYGFRTFDTAPEVMMAAFTCISIGLNVLVMGISSWAIVYGQDLAIRGTPKPISLSTTMKTFIIVLLYYGCYKGIKLYCKLSLSEVLMKNPFR